MKKLVIFASCLVLYSACLVGCVNKETELLTAGGFQLEGAHIYDDCFFINSGETVAIEIVCDQPIAFEHSEEHRFYVGGVFTTIYRMEKGDIKRGYYAPLERGSWELK